jgi:quercetin dioxygenase-like cupin family protein
MSVSAPPSIQSRRPAALVPVAIALAVLGILLFLPRFANSDGAAASAGRGHGGAESARALPPFPTRAPGPVWGNNVKTRVALQQRLDRLPPDPPYTFRVTELEMEPGAKIFEHRQLGVGAHLVVRGAITIDDLDHGTSATYQPGQAYFEGLEPLHRAQNGGREANRILMFDILPASRGFDGQQRFTAEGKHNEGEVRSGPYVQVPLRDLPEGPLMLRVTEMAFGPKAKTETHARLGPTIFYVQEGTATVRKDWDNSSDTFGTNGYFYESGREPFILENKPARPAAFVAVEILPASIGDGPSTVLADD